MQWLRQFNVLQHCSILTVGDCDKHEAKRYFEEHLLQEVPEELRGRLNFEEMYEVFGGKVRYSRGSIIWVMTDSRTPKLAHLQAFVGDFGKL